MINHYSFFGYILAMAIVLFLCTIAYRWLMESRVNPSINRLIILAIYFLMIFSPILVLLIPEPYTFSQIEIGESRNYMIDSPVNMDEESSTVAEIKNLITRFYYIGIGIMVTSLLISIIRLLVLMKTAEVVDIKGRDVFLHSYKSLSSFSWNGKIFIYADSLYKSPEELDIMLKHEEAHVNGYHWIDLIFSQIVLIFQWFNPAAWFCCKELQRIHEYEADRYVLSAGIDKKRYQMLLINNISRNRFFSGLTDGLNNCSLKKRLLMMNKIKFKNGWIIRAGVIFGFAVLGGFIIHTPVVASGLMESPQDVKSENRTVIKSGITSLVGDKGIKSDKDTVKYNTEIYIDGEKASYEEMQKINPDNIESITVLRKEPSQILIKTKDETSTSESKVVTEETIQVIGYGTQKKYNAKKRVTETLETAHYAGGESQLMNDLAKTIIYPKEAEEREIQGNVTISFVINPDGTTKDYKVVKSADPLLNEEAIRALKSLPGKWVPTKDNGKNISSVYEQTITFKIPDKKKPSVIILNS